MALADAGRSNNLGRPPDSSRVPYARLIGYKSSITAPSCRERDAGRSTRVEQDDDGCLPGPLFLVVAVEGEDCRL